MRREKTVTSPAGESVRPLDATPRRTVAVIAAVVWMALVLGLYYWVHKPLTPALAVALGGALLDLAVAAGFAAIAAGLGRRLLKPLDLSGWSAAERLALNGMLGLGALSLIVALVGIAALNALSVALVLALAGVWARREIGAWLREARGWLRGSLPASGWERTLAQFAFVLLALALLLATLPPRGGTR